MYCQLLERCPCVLTQRNHIVRCGVLTVFQQEKTSTDLRLLSTDKRDDRLYSADMCAKYYQELFETASGVSKYAVYACLHTCTPVCIPCRYHGRSLNLQHPT